MSSPLRCILIATFFYYVSLYKYSSWAIIRNVDFQITYDELSRNLYIHSSGKGKCTSHNYYINDKCKIINNSKKTNENNKAQCLYNQKCIPIAKYIFKHTGIETVTEDIFLEPFVINDKLNILQKEKCNTQVYINDKIKCLCCINDVLKNIQGYEDPKIKENVTYQYTQCKCLLNYQDIYEDLKNMNKCENFECNNGLCTIQTNGQPFCSCFENYYFEKKSNTCKKHKESLEHIHKINKNRETIEMTETDTLNNVTTNDNIPHHNNSYNYNNDNHIIHNTKDLEQHNKSSNNPHNGNTIISQNNYNNCPLNQIKNKKGICQTIINSEESVCLRIDCSISSNEFQCVCINLKGEQIKTDIFDVSYINICTLNNINCDNGICNNILKKDELGCICNENYIYDYDLKVCLSYSTNIFLRLFLLCIIYAVILFIL
ncbi:hypothetical protein PGSY75_1002300 [Plasmodium gaboni]|uniref:Uncharacterized protein n=1 Tax=Plasmodium gaboni TaxID=647221 RepID=A0A151LK81_9APIC|nr:hypothetical protein PGSY75_1002300 [Plasmodium gaboni]KYN99398.1 hypothetical protein PGSY75_1002300 [Plasmodium gaboni]